MQKIFDNFIAQRKGGISRRVVQKWGSAGGRVGTNGGGNGVLYLRSYSNDQDWHDALGIIDELPHIAGSKGGWPSHNEYDDYALAVAAYSGPYTEKPPSPSMDPFTAFPDLKRAAKNANRNDARWSNYWHHLLRKHCVVPTGGTP